MQPWGKTTPPRLGIVVPCYNEEKVLAHTALYLRKVLNELIAEKQISHNSFILFVDDGSKDKTWEIIESLCLEYSDISGLKLSRNAGHQNALLAGLMFAKVKTDMIITIDADLQDDVNAIRKFVQKFWEGYEIVYGVRDDRTSDTWFKRTTAQYFYKLMQLMGADIVYNHADYRLMSRRAVEYLSEFKEVNLFLRGIVPLIGLPSTQVTYRRQERLAGESKYPLKKMLTFAIDGITSFSVRPIRMVTMIGFLFIALSLLVGIYALFMKLSGKALYGWTSIVISVWFIGGIHLMCTGLVGEYVGKIYKEVKQRPKYLIEKNLLPKNWYYDHKDLDWLEKQTSATTRVRQ